MDYVIGIDAGATSTKLSAFSLAGTQLEHVVTGPGNLVVDRDAAIWEIQRGIHELRDLLAENTCRLILAGIAGAGVFGNDMVAKQVANGLTIPTVVLNDGELGLMNKLQGKDGILAIAGTGSVVYGKYVGTIKRVGGWGHLLGDEGSAFYIGKAAVEHVLCDYDQGKQTDFSKSMLAHTDNTDVFGLVHDYYAFSKSQVASLAEFVSDRSQSDLIAREILWNAGIAIAKQVETLVIKLGAKRTIRLAISGSVLEKNKIVSEALLDALKKEKYEVKLVENDAPNTDAVLWTPEYQQLVKSCL